MMNELDAVQIYLKKRIAELKAYNKRAYPPNGDNFLTGTIHGMEDVERGFRSGRYKRMVTMANKKSRFREEWGDVEP